MATKPRLRYCIAAIVASTIAATLISIGEGNAAPQALRFAIGISWKDANQDLAGNIAPEIITDGKRIIFSTPYSQNITYSGPMLGILTSMNGGSGCKSYKRTNGNRETLCVNASRISQNQLQITYKLKTELAAEGRPGNFLNYEASFTLRYDSSYCQVNVNSAGRSYINSGGRIYPATEILNQVCMIS